MEKINGKIIRILTQKENDWGRYILNTDNDEKLVVGVIPNASMGMQITLTGEEQKNVYGTQFVIKNVLYQKEDDCAGLRQFFALRFVKGIGPVLGERIINAFGNEFFNIIENEEKRDMLITIKGITKTKVKTIAKNYEKVIPYKDITLFLNGAGTKDQIMKIYNKYGDSSINKLKKNPYVLIDEIDGFGFAKADKIALSAGMKPDSIERISYAINYIIQQGQLTNGHCYLTIEEIKESLDKLLAPTHNFEDISEIVAENSLKAGYENWIESREKLIKAHNPSQETLDELTNIITVRKDINNSLYEALDYAINNGVIVNDDGRIYTKKMYNVEKETAELIVKLVNSNSTRFVKPEIIESCIKDVEKRKTEELKEKGFFGNFEVTSEQRKAVYTGVMNRISIISGGPGRGKTAISEIIAETFLRSGRRYDKRDVIMVAPTGKAAKRITESTGYEGSTIHRLLSKYEDDRPENKLVLVDESSMVDIVLAHKLIKCVKDCNIVFVGDVDQIPSVGPGMVLRDLIESGVIPCILLKEGHRNSGSIANNSALINQGLKLDKYTYDNNFHYIPSGSEDIAVNVINKYFTKVSEYGIENVMLAVPMRERGITSVNSLNKRIQQLRTAGADEAVVGNNLYRVGDRVMQTVNNYNFVSLKDNNIKTGVFNGDTGTIVCITKTTNEDGEQDYKVVVKFDDGSIGGYTRATLKELTLAYAITQHKCQGSEAKCVIIAYTYADYMLLNRALFYTAVTRAKKEIYLFAEEKYKYGKLLSAIDIAVSNVQVKHRNTLLKQRIKELNDNV